MADRTEFQLGISFGITQSGVVLLTFEYGLSLFQKRADPFILILG